MLFLIEDAIPDALALLLTVLSANLLNQSIWPCIEVSLWWRYERGQLITAHLECRGSLPHLFALSDLRSADSLGLNISTPPLGLLSAGETQLLHLMTEVLIYYND